MTYIDQKIFDSILKTKPGKENTYDDISALEFSYATYECNVYTYDLIYYTPVIDTIGRTQKNGQWQEYSITEKQLEALRERLKMNHEEFLSNKEEKETMESSLYHKKDLYEEYGVNRSDFL